MTTVAIIDYLKNLENEFKDILILEKTRPFNIATATLEDLALEYEYLKDCIQTTDINLKYIKKITDIYKTNEEIINLSITYGKIHLELKEILANKANTILLNSVNVIKNT